MNYNFNKISTLIIYTLSIIALSFIIIEFFHDIQLKSSINSEIEDIALRFYYDIDEGNYEDLFKISIEGKWNKKIDSDNENYYYINGAVEKNNFIEAVTKDFGENGWRIHFTSLETAGTNKISRNEFTNQYFYENEVLRYVDSKNDIKYIYLVDVKGYILRNCGLYSWKKRLPIITIDQEYKVLLPGNPEDLSYLQKKYWFSNVGFKYIEKLLKKNPQ